MNNVKRGIEWEALCSRGFDSLGSCTVAKMGAPVRVIGYPGKKPGRKNTGAFSGFFEAKGSCDYEGGFEGRVVSIEAKRTKSARWSISSVKPHQYARMINTMNYHAGLSGVLLAMDHQSGSTAFFGIDMIGIMKSIDLGRKSLTPAILFDMAEDSASGVMILPIFMTPAGPAVGLLKFLRMMMSRERI